MDKQYSLYILANKRNGTLYIGSISELIVRVHKHRTNHDPKSFTARYEVHRLFHIEPFDDPESMVCRERRLKEWPRDWKVNLIGRDNPDWGDLYLGLLP